MPASTGARPPHHTMTPERLPVEVSAWYVALTLFIAWLLNLLPYARIPGVPDFFGMCLVYWALHRPLRGMMLIALVAGLLLDVHDAALLGEHALAYILMLYWIMVLRQRMLRFGLIGQTLHVFPVFVLAWAVAVAIRSWLVASLPGWWWIADALASAFFWPMFAWLLQLPQRVMARADPA